MQISAILKSYHARRERRQLRPPQRYGYDLVAYALVVTEEIEFAESSTFQEAITYPNAIERTQAMCKEMELLFKNQTWQLVKPPKVL
jgi:hypothetical protein